MPALTAVCRGYVPQAKQGVDSVFAPLRTAQCFLKSSLSCHASSNHAIAASDCAAVSLFPHAEAGLHARVASTPALGAGQAIRFGFPWRNFFAARFFALASGDTGRAVCAGGAGLRRRAKRNRPARTSAKPLWVVAVLDFL